MKKLWITLAAVVVALAFALVACGEKKAAPAGDKKAEEKKADKKAEEKKAEAPKAPTPPAPPPPAAPAPAAPAPGAAAPAPGGDAAIGVAECDDYLKKATECFGKNPAAKAALEPALKANKDAWSKAAATPAGKDGLKVGCKAALDGLAQNPMCK